MAPALTLQAWFRMWQCEPLSGPVSRLQGDPLIKALLEPSVQAAGEDHPTDLPGGESAESHENPWASDSHWRGLERKGLHFSQDPRRG